jgi:hypothetical protein
MDERDRPTPGNSSRGFGRSLFFATSIGLAFGGGLVAGGIGDTSVASPEPEPLDPVARALERTRAYEELVKSQKLTWHGELTGLDAPLPPPPPLAKVVLKPTTTAPTPATAGNQVLSGVETKTSSAAEATQAATPPIVDQAMRTPEPEHEPVPHVQDDDAHARGARFDRDDEAGLDVQTRQDPKKLDAAIARVVGGNASREPTARFALQLASVPSPEAARAEVDKWKERGLSVSVVTSEVAGKGTMYRVRATGFSSKDEAAAKKAELKEGIIVVE